MMDDEYSRPVWETEPPAYITITQEEYDELIADRDELSRLYANGVDSWEGYAQ